MAKPIEGIPVFKGKAAKWLGRHLETAKPNPTKAQQARNDKQVADKIKPLSRN